METSAFRGVVRGSTKDGRRVRRVRVIEAPTYETAWQSFGEIYESMAKACATHFRFRGASDSNLNAPQIPIEFRHPYFSGPAAKPASSFVACSPVPVGTERRTLPCGR